MDYVYKLSPIIQVVIAVCSSYLLLARFRYQDEIQRHALHVLKDYKRDESFSFQLLSYLASTPHERKNSDLKHMWFDTLAGKFYRIVLVKNLDNNACLGIVAFWIIILYEAAYCYASGTNSGFVYRSFMQIDHVYEYRYLLLYSALSVSMLFPLLLVYCGRKVVVSAKNSTNDLKQDLQARADEMDKDAAKARGPNF